MFRAVVISLLHTRIQNIKRSDLKILYEYMSGTFKIPPPQKKKIFKGLNLLWKKSLFFKSLYSLKKIWSV